MNIDSRSLLTKTKKHLAEIVVIIFSILAAFALDNWRDNQLQNREEIAILQTALEELESDLTDIDFNVAVHRQAISSMDIVLDQLKSGVLYNDSLAEHFHNGFSMPRFVHSTSAFETMQSSGMDIVSNEELRRKLIRLYGRSYNNYRTIESEHANEINYGIRTIGPGRFMVGYNFDEVGRSYHGTMVPTNFNALKNDEEFLYYLRTLRNRTNVFVNFFYRNLRSDVEGVHDLLEAEIHRRSN